MWFSYKEAVTILGKDKADAIFESSWVSKWRQKLTEEEKKDKEYLSMTESAHAKRIHKWLDDIWIKHNHSPNEAGQSWSKNILIMMARKKAEWTSKGYPDLHILIPYKEWLVNLFIELKKAPWKKWGWNGSSFNIEQAEWLNELSKIPFTFVALCQWSEQAMNLIDSMINELKYITTEQVLWLWKNRNIIDYMTRITGN